MNFDQEFIVGISAQVTEAVDRAALDPIAWDDFVEILGARFPGTCVVVQRFDLRRKRVDYDRILNLHPDDEASYRQHYCSLNPWIPYMRTVPSGTVLVSERDFPSAKFKSAEFHDWLRPELRAATSLTLESTSESLTAVAMHYAISRTDIYDEVVSEVLRSISRPLVRSMEAARLFEQTIDRGRSAAAIVSRPRDIACVVDERLKVVEANARAEGEFQSRKVISTRAGRFSLMAPDINGWLEDTLRLLVLGLEPETATRVFFADAAYQIGVVRLPGGSGGRSLFSAGPLFLIVVRNLSVPVEAGTIADLAKAFGLTPAEQRLCESLLLGRSLKETADTLRIAPDTARQRLKAVFRKTDTQKQSELIALLGRLL